MSAFFASTFGKVIAVMGLLVALSGMAIWLMNNLESAGEAKVTASVEHATTEALEGARADKEKADGKVRTDPPAAVIDSTR